MKGTDKVMFAGLLTGRPEEEMSGLSDDLLQGLSQMHEQAWQAMLLSFFHTCASK